MDFGSYTEEKLNQSKNAFENNQNHSTNSIFECYNDFGDKMV